MYMSIYSIIMLRYRASLSRNAGHYPILAEAFIYLNKRAAFIREDFITCGRSAVGSIP